MAADPSVFAQRPYAFANRLDPGFYADARTLSQMLAGTADIMAGLGAGASANVDQAREDFQRFKAIERRANDLLCSRLAPAEVTLWRQTERLMRPSLLWPGVEYLIQRAGPVKVVDRGVVTQSLCVVAANGEPEADRVMTILDLIESDERRLWEMAVATPGARERIVPLGRSWAEVALAFASAAVIGVAILLVATLFA